MTAAITAHGRTITVTRSGNHLTLNPRRRLLARPVRLRIDKDVRYVEIHEPRGLNPAGWIELGLFIDIGDPKFAQHAVSRVDYHRSHRREFAALVLAGGWHQTIVT